MMNTIKKWLLINDEERLVIEKKDMNPHIPLNRYLDKAGFYQLGSQKIEGFTYLMVYDPSEEGRLKTKLLISKVSDTEGFVDLDEADEETIKLLAKQWMGLETIVH